MNLYIDTVNGLIVMLGFFVGYLVYRRPLVGAGTQPQRHSDLAGGIAAALAAILILAFLLGVGDGKAPEAEDTRTTRAVTAGETHASAQE